jgi:FkbM family methyltransferase
VSTSRAEAVLEAAVGRTPARHVIDPERAVRLTEFLVVGAVGVVIDLSVTLSLLGSVHYTVANAAGFVVAVTSNFIGNWLWTFDRPDGSLPHQYFSYVGLHAVTFGLRVAVVIALVESVLAMPPAVATGAGIVVAAIANFLGTERIFDGVDELWLDAVAAANVIAHAIYSSRLRDGLRAVGLYHPVYTLYAHALGILYREDERTITIGQASATLGTASGPQAVSVLHTEAKEEGQLQAFVGSLKTDDCVWDVGANVGVYSCLAASVADEVVPIEPYKPNVEPLSANLRRNGSDATVRPIALGDEDGAVSLTVERAEEGTQTPTVDGENGAIPLRRGDNLDAPPPDVLKVDVEGAEASVLCGMGDRLDGVRVVLCETHGDDGECRSILEAAGFDVQRREHSGQAYLRGVRA